jgi:O-antigen/teichoic acid export membrane protein
MTFSIKVLFARIGTYLEGRIDALIIGPFFGPAAIGLLRLAERAIDTVAHIAAHPAALLSLPHLSRQQDDRQTARREISRCIEAATILTFPAMVFLAVVADDLMLVLGEEWVAAAAPLRIFCIAGAARAITIVVGQALQAAGRPLLYAYLMWAITIASGIAFAIIAWELRNDGLAAQIMGIAIWKAVITLVLVVPVSLGMIRFVAGYSPLEAMRAIFPALGTSAIVGAAGVGALLILDRTHWSSWLRLVILSAAMGGAFAVSAAIVKPSLRRQLIDRLRKSETSDLNGATSELAS